MNMISTGAFLNEMDASNKQPTVAEKFAAVWEKKNAKAARAGGVSLMALSLAACGGSSSTTTTTTDTSTDTATTPVTPAVPASQSFTLTSSLTDNFTGGDGADIFSGTNSTIDVSDTISGGAGDDTLKYVDTSTAGATLPGLTMSGIEKIQVQNLSNSSDAADGTAEVLTVTVGAMQAGQTISIGDKTYLATTDKTAAEVATALVAGTTYDPTGYTLAKTGVDTITATATTVGNKTDIAVGGNVTKNIGQSTKLTITSDNSGAIDTGEYYQFTINGTTVTTGAAGASKDTGDAAALIAAAINGAVGKNVATYHDAAGDGSIVYVHSADQLVFGSVSDNGSNTLQTTSVAASLVKSQQTITVSDGTTASIQAGDTVSLEINGETVTTTVDAITAGDEEDNVAVDMAAAINAWYGADIATAALHVVTIDSGDVGLNINKTVTFTEATGTTADPTFAVADKSGSGSSSGVVATDAPVSSLVNGTAAVTATANAMSVDGANWTADVNTVSNYASKGALTFTNLQSLMDVEVASMTSGTATTVEVAAAKAAGANDTMTLALDGNTSSGNITLGTSGGNDIENIVINATGKNTVTDIISRDATSWTVNADNTTDLNLSAADVSDKATLTVSGAGKVTLNTLETAFETVNLAGNSGGVTATLNTNVQTLTGGSGNDTITTAALAKTATVSGGAGDDTLVIGTATDLDSTTEGAKYTGFETVRAASGDFDASVVAGIDNIQMTGAGTLSGLSATQAQNVQIRADGAYTVALESDTGTSDSVSIALGTGSKSTAAVSLTGGGLTANGIETINLSTNAGPTAATGADSTSTIAAFTADKATSIVLTGSSFDITNIATTKKVTIDGSALTGDGASTPVGLVTAGNAASGSTIIGSDVNDTFNIGAEAQTYSGRAGDDTFVIGGTNPTSLTEADGTTDLVIDGGSNGTTGDKVKYADSTITDNLTLTDTDFKNISNVEDLELANTGDLSLTTGTNFDAAYSGGAQITTGALVNNKTFTLSAGLSERDIDVTVDATNLTGSSDKDITITTGSGADKVTIADGTSFTGATNGGTVSIDTGAGADTITVTLGTLANGIAATYKALVIDAGTGADTIDMTKVNGHVSGTDVSGKAEIVIAEGDSTTTAYDTVKGFDVGDASDVNDLLQFDGTAAVSDFTDSADSGVIKSHSIANGLVSFDDAAAYATALTISDSNLSDVLAYLSANTDDNDTVAFKFDSDSNGSMESTFVYHNGATATDSLVLLSDVVLTGISDTLTTVTAGYAVID